MCYSAMIEADVRKLERRFRAKIDWTSFETAFKIRTQYQNAKIPSAIDTYILQNADTPLQKRLANLAKDYYKAEIEKATTKLKKYEQDVKDFEAKIKNGSKAKGLKEKLEKRRATVEKHKEKIENYRKIEEKGAPRIFPNYYAPVLIKDNKDYWIRLMRYHLCPKNGNELNVAKYNLFNARKDRLLDAKTWKPLFGEQHAIFPFYRFYESVEGGNGAAKIIYFEPDTGDLMWSAALFENAKIKEGQLMSFAAITDEPPPEVAAAGHDRCPIFLAEENIDQWLDPKSISKDHLLKLLESVVRTYYRHQAA